MSRLRVYDDTNPSTVKSDTRDGHEMVTHLRKLGVGFERWSARRELASDAAPEDIIAAYQADVDRLRAERGYRFVDVLRMTPEHPERVAMRNKLFDEHTHPEDEVRFFVQGSGLFVFHVLGQVHSVLCERGDLIRVPAGLAHWFDMGERPRFTAIRLFANPDGWVASYTGSDISRRFPKFGE
jgi:1,2-dihydroxy-3-keto-5-methylthiopentene dioxygenase